MSRIARAALAPHLSLKSKLAITALGLALASLAGAAHAGDDTPTSIMKRAPCAKPQYTQSALRNDAEGTTTVNFLIDTDGSVIDSRIMRSSGDRSLDEETRSAISKCRFKPAMKDGQPQRAWVPVQYVWTLEPAGKAPAALP